MLLSIISEILRWCLALLCLQMIMALVNLWYLMRTSEEKFKYKKEVRFFWLPWGYIIVKAGTRIQVKVGLLKGKYYRETLELYENYKAQ